MNSVLGIFSNTAVICAVMAWFIAQLIKCILYRDFSVKRFLASGGMPSSHTSSVVALTTLIGSRNGFDSPIFAVAAVFSVIVMYDAAGVSRETGRQGKAINEILQNVLVGGEPITDDIMKELVGHRPIEVAMGALLGLVVAVIFILAGW